MSNRIIQFSQLGKFGRFGNQLFQYLFARAYTEKYDAILEIPTWVGEKIFKNVSNRPISKNLPRTVIDKITFGEVNIDLFGYFQKQEFINILSESKIKEWLQFQDKWVEIFSTMRSSLIAHLRRGDYIDKYSNIFAIISKESYYKACDKFDLPKACLIWKREALQIRWREVENCLGFLPDFFQMMLTKNLLRSNSTFSFWAGFFNKNKVFSPIVNGKTGHCDVDFIEGNWPSIVSGNPDFIFEE